MFRELIPYQLKYNETYKIDNKYKAIYKGKVYLYIEWVLEFDNVRMLDNQHTILSYFTPLHSFYEFVSQKEHIQCNMEQRALNLILRRVTGDEFFTW
jgi:hypothetical protein